MIFQTRESHKESLLYNVMLNYVLKITNIITHNYLGKVVFSAFAKRGGVRAIEEKYGYECNSTSQSGLN